jgi:hypothetical protein
MPTSVPRYRGPRLEQAPQSFPWCIQANDGGCLWSRHGAGIQQDTLSRGYRGVGRVKLSTAITEPANPASSSERWKSSFPASSARCRGSASPASTTGRRRATSSAATAGQHESACATAEPIPAHVRGDGIRLAWGPTCSRPQDRSSKHLATKESIRRRLPRGGKLRCHRRFPASGLRTSCRRAGGQRPGAEDGRVMQNQFGLKPKM